DSDSDSDSDSNSDHNTDNSTHSNANNGHNNHGNKGTHSNGNHHEKVQLPETGNNEESNGTLFGSLFAAAGSLFLAGKRRRNKKEDK
ncbi:LPXTG cell wall anchor domain-containing protein, partial [Staphylococcus sp. HMSC072H03]